MNMLLTILRRRGVGNPSDYLVSPEGKRNRSMRGWPFRSTEEVEVGFAKLRHLRVLNGRSEKVARSLYIKVPTPFQTAN